MCKLRNGRCCHPLSRPDDVGLVPDFQERVPGACADCHSVLGYSKTRNSVVMASQNAYSIVNMYCLLG